MALGQEEIGRRVALARGEADLTQAQLAERIGIETAQTISRYERGETEISPKRLRRIAEATGKPLDFFIMVPSEIAAQAATQADVLSRLVRVEELLEELLRELLRRLPAEQSEPTSAR